MSERLAALKLEGQVTWLGWAPGGSFVSEPAERLDLTYAGIEGDRHAGLTRKSGAREPWYPRGTPMRNERQLSLLGAEELADVAAAMGMAVLEPAWIGGNLVLAGIPDFSRLPPRTILMFPSGAAIRIDGDNGPCRQSGRAIAAATGVAKHETAFVVAAKHRRGLVGWVERGGAVCLGDPVTVRVWEQALYAP